MVHPNSHRVSRVPWYLGVLQGRHLTFRLQGCHLLWRLFPEPSARLVLCNFPIRLQPNQATSHDTEEAKLVGLALLRFGLVRVRSPLLTESLLLSLPGGTEMVHFPPFASTELCVHSGMTRHDPCRVSPFGNLRINACLRLPEAYRSLSRPSSPLCAKASTACP